MKKEFYSNGKLLLTGEYLVLDGATALAIPTVYGQKLSVESTDSNLLEWQSEDEKGVIWFRVVFSSELNIEETSDPEVAQRLQEILKTARQANPGFLPKQTGYRVHTKLDFQRNWGLGTSSTLVNNIAQWAKVDAFQLLDDSFGGSGYDIAAAQANGPVLYTRTFGKPLIEPVTLNWNFTDHLFFVHLNRKQDSKEGISQYRALSKTDSAVKDRISQLAREVAKCGTLGHFIGLMEEHETIISSLLSLPTIKETLFLDYSGLVKSLGAWGGDFVLACGDDAAQEYFRKKGYETIIPFAEMML